MKKLTKNQNVFMCFKIFLLKIKIFFTKILALPRQMCYYFLEKRNFFIVGEMCSANEV